MCLKGFRPAVDTEAADPAGEREQTDTALDAAAITDPAGLAWEAAAL